MTVRAQQLRYRVCNDVWLIPPLSLLSCLVRPPLRTCPAPTGFVAKILVDEGTEVPTGTPVMVLVEEEEHVAAFAV